MFLPPGWFYHAPARRVHNEPVGYPAMSQIPGLAEDDGRPEELPRPLFRDTDTKYVRLAKQGGRQSECIRRKKFVCFY